MSSIEIIALIFSYSFSSLIVYSQKIGLTYYGRMSIGGLSVCGLIGLLFFHHTLCNQLFCFGHILNVAFVTGSYEISLQISLHYQGRRFYLHARDSQDLAGLGLPKSNVHFTPLDKLISLFLILGLVGGPLLWILLLRQLFCL